MRDDMDAASLEPTWKLLQASAPALLSWFGLVALSSARFFGLTCTAPLLGNAAVALRTRLGLALLLGACGAASPNAWVAAVHGPEVLWLGLAEFLLGAAIGFGARLLLTGLDLAAGLIDQQSGTPFFAGSHPLGSGSSSAMGQWLALLGAFAWLSLAPGGGMLRLVAGVLETFRLFPPGAIGSVESPLRLVQDVMLSSLVLGLQVAAPVIVSVGLLQCVWGMLARSRGGGTWQAPLTPVRIGMAFVILAATTTDLGERIARGCDGVLRGSIESLASPEAGQEASR